MMTSNELIAFMPPTLANEIVEYAYAADKPVYRAALAAVAEVRRVRPVFLERQPRVQRHKMMLEVLTQPYMEPAAGNLIRTWLLKKQTAMLGDFLDHLGIPHKDGVVEDLPAKVEDEKLKAAVDFLLEKHPREAVVVYLHAFNTMNETSWTNLNEMLNKDPRLQL